jgi:RimJ/RimL family protein N-acetyltransferase
MNAPQIITERLILSPLGDHDAQALFAYRSRPEVCRYQSWEPRSVEDVARFIDVFRSLAFDTPGTWFQLGMRLKDTAVLAGDLGVHFLEDESHQVEIGFTVAPDHQRRGLGFEAVAALLGHLFGPLGKHRVFASADPRNQPSLALLRKVGMRQEAHFRESMWFKDEWVDDVVFAILESEWTRRAGVTAPRR